MTLTLTIDAEAWRAHLREVADQIPGLVPVAKGNGYGLGNTLLSHEVETLGIGVIAVGIASEARALLDSGWQGDVVVLNPWRPSELVATDLLDESRVVTTVSRAGDLEQIRRIQPRARVQLELRTSMLRHGLLAEQLPDIDLDELTFEGWSVHLPADGSLNEATQLAQAAIAHRPGEVWVSHLSVADYRTFRRSLDGAARMRVGTRLWLGAPKAFKTTATILDVHPVKRGQHIGYHQARAPKDGFIVIASGGTAHGVALAAPVPQRSLQQRLVTVAEGALDAAGRSLSPFTLGGKKRSFAEPPHMHSSMLFVPGADPLVAVGDEVPVTCRMTTTHFDRITIA